MSDVDPFAPLNGRTGSPSESAKPKMTWVSTMPVPSGAPAAPGSHFKLGKPTQRWTYRDAAGELLGYACRFEAADGKQFRPLTYGCRGDGAPEWRWESWSGKRPLYGLAGLAQRPAAPVLVTEGEKAADAAGALLPGVVVVTSPNGSKSAAKADWAALRGHQVTVWPDADVAGLEYAQAVAKAAIAAGALGVAIVSPPSGVKVGWDAADARDDGWDSTRAAELVAAAKPAEYNAKPKQEETAAEGEDDAGGRRRVPQSDTLLRLTDFCELWHDADEIAYATYPVNGHRQNAEIRSTTFRRWLSGIYFKETGGAIRSQALEDGIRILEARAVNDGPLYQPFLRTGEHDGKIYVDLGDSAWRAVEVGKDEIRIIDSPPVKLMRSPAMRPLPEPDFGESINRLRQFINVRSDDDFTLVVAWLIMAFRPTGPYPILVVNGEQGTGKSFFCRLIRGLIDPRRAPNRGVPKEDRDLVVSAGQSWVLTYDNLSSIPVWLADALCRLATGSGFSTRTLHSDREETIFDAARPIILNGISSVTDRPDLADRAVTVNLRVISDEDRRSERDLLAAYEIERPYIIGALLGGVRSAIENLEKVHFDRLPRMADFAQFATAAEPGLGWDNGVFMKAYLDNRSNVADVTFEADTVAVAVHKLVISQLEGMWVGTATQLLAALNAAKRGENRTTPSAEGAATELMAAIKAMSKGGGNDRLWPNSPQAMGNRLDRIAPLLRRKRIAVDRHHGAERTITLTWLDAVSDIEL